MSSKHRIWVLSVCLVGVLTYVAGVEIWPRIQLRIQAAQVDALGVRLDLLHQKYLSGDIEQARRCLREQADILQTDSILEDDKRAHGLILTYARLHMLESRAGNTDAAAAYWVKTQYWLLHNYEVQGMRYSAASKMLEQTPQASIEVLDKWEKKQTNGKGPKYLDNLRSGTQPTSRYSQ